VAAGKTLQARLPDAAVRTDDGVLITRCKLGALIGHRRDTATTRVTEPTMY
jgi:hypothetical protein